METISIDHSRKDYGVMVLLGAIMFGASLFVLIGSLVRDFPFRIFGLQSEGLGILVGGFGTLFFGFAFFYILKRFLFPKGALVITEEGIINRTNAIGSNRVIPFTWMKKAKVEIVNASGNIGIELKDDRQYLESLPWLKRKTSEMNQRSFGTSVISLDVPVDSRERLEELTDIINERIERTEAI
ncbi:MAG TPA: STM3941 family protein [Atopostipes sp.]|nr:STM3941 family protein [Atopostipes sp.]